MYHLYSTHLVHIWGLLLWEEGNCFEFFFFKCQNHYITYFHILPCTWYDAFVRIMVINYSIYFLLALHFLSLYGLSWIRFLSHALGTPSDFTPICHYMNVLNAFKKFLIGFILFLSIRIVHCTYLLPYQCWMKVDIK